MKLTDLSSTLHQMEVRPEHDPERLRAWLNHEDSIGFLLDSSFGRAPVYIAAGNFYLHSFLLPEAALAEDYFADLISWNSSASEGWSYGFHYDDNEKRKAVFPPFDRSGDRQLDKREPLFHYRHFNGYPAGSEAYLEIDQRIAQVLGLHWVPREHAYCKLDHLGDIKQVVQVSSPGDSLLATVDLADLDFYMFLTDTLLVRLFDITRFKGYDWSSGRSETLVKHARDHTELHARLIVQDEEQSYLRGFQLIRRRSPDHIMQAILNGEDPFPKEYAVFLAWDWKHRRLVKSSCAPSALASYFEESELPFQTTPAFFPPDVLLKYKQEPHKYSLTTRGISCRGTWSLSYDVNEEGQVHAYLCDLANLPHEEQVYWASFNEAPMAGISKRAYKTDFLAEWDTEYDPLPSLVDCLENFPSPTRIGEPLPIWRTPSAGRPFARLAHVLTDSPKEWEDQILELARVIIDNFDKGNIRRIAASKGTDDPQLGSLKLLRLCLRAVAVDEEVIHEVCDPLQELWSIRSAGIAHFGKSPPDHDLRKQHRSLLTALDTGLRRLAELVDHGALNIKAESP